MSSGIANQASEYIQFVPSALRKFFALIIQDRFEVSPQRVVGEVKAMVWSSSGNLVVTQW